MNMISGLFTKMLIRPPRGAAWSSPRQGEFGSPVSESRFLSSNPGANQRSSRILTYHRGFHQLLNAPETRKLHGSARAAKIKSNSAESQLRGVNMSHLETAASAASSTIPYSYVCTYIEYSSGEPRISPAKGALSQQPCCFSWWNFGVSQFIPLRWIHNPPCRTMLIVRDIVRADLVR
ncbi:hypothetical protein K437DRAFT_19079 [Tilletiaria anomala UBC 951]|uniref:Uncharacterized protein n=1 Tax=Tilletiaria anomala (strain ATCC 24038 / CBS 436.72 / UBC 951) TaxID=1037660 RepID=A0A066VF63_TILAU|nr:uncharacterized protein K437DRAFT_19079 [Tilletiaria anomala UBC 951]KDN38938.1 hypothetical protein K437DRAFT_19079 [Tilletiaria anomala UBC 951]